MIPKVIHYCWFGNNPMPQKVKKCIASWKRILYDYEIKRWDETNIDINENLYIKQAYELGKWAFVSDYVRAKVLREYGGIYLDADMMIYKRFDFAMKNKAFCGLANPGVISAGLLAFEPGHHLIKEHLSEYANEAFINEDSTLNLKTNVTRISELFIKRGMGKEDRCYDLGDIYIYSTEYFYPTDFEGKRSNFTANTCAEHLHLASWLPPEKQLKMKIKRFLNKTGILERLVNIKHLMLN